MGRIIRQDYEGAWHHVMNRGRNRDFIFLDDYDAGLFLMMIESMINQFGIEVHAYSLMPNHYHLLVRTPLGNLSQAMRYLGASYTRAFNNRHKKDGALFRGRFNSQLVDDEQYLTYLLAYIHLNPVRAGLIRRLDSMEAGTGHRRYMGLDVDPPWLVTDEMLRRFGSREKLKENMIHLRRKQDAWVNGMNLTDGWISNVKPQKTGARRKKTSRQAVTVEQLLREIAAVAGVKKRHLLENVMGPGGNVARRFAVWALHSATCMSHREVGHALGMRPEMAAKTLSRAKENIAQFNDWPDKWLEKHPQKVSSVQT